MNATLELLRFKADLLERKKAIQENQVTEILGTEFPELNEQLEKIPDCLNAYKSIQCFADYTKQLLKRSELSKVKSCFNLAEKLLKEGDYTVRNAIQNVYVFSVSHLFDFATPLSYKIKDMMNKTLLQEYKKQIMSSGI